MNVLLDTNILARLANPQHHVHHDLAEAACEAICRNGYNPCIVPQSLYEFWALASRPQDANGLEMSTDDIRSEIESMLGLFHFLRDERAIFHYWLDLVTLHHVQGKPTHDARLVAAMLRHGVTHLLTFNTGDFARYTEIAAVHPDEVVSGVALGATRS